MRILLASIIACLLVLGACGGGQGEIDPIPTPMQKPVDERILLSASQQLSQERGPGSDAMVAIVGMAGAIDSAMRVVVEDAGGAFAIESQVREDGSFATALPLSAGDTVRIYARRRVEGGPPVDGPAIERRVPPSERGVNPDPPATVIQQGQGAGGPAITTIVRDDGTIEVAGTLDTVDPEVEVVLGNVNNGALASATSDADGAFVATIAGVRGDVLVIFARWPGSEHADPAASSEAITWRVD